MTKGKGKLKTLSVVDDLFAEETMETTNSIDGSKVQILLDKAHVLVDLVYKGDLSGMLLRA